MRLCKQVLSVLLSFSVTLSVIGLEGCKKAAKQEQPPTATNATPTPDQLYQLVAPIALFPDNLLAQVLAASTYPDQVSAAYNWLQQNSNLQGQQLMDAVNQQPWDASVKGLTQFSDVLHQMSSNLSWTSALGDAYYNYPQSVMNAVQVMRQRAQKAGNLNSNDQMNVSLQNQAPGSAPPPPEASGPQQTVIVQPPPQTIIIQPAQPQVVYVPTYNPTVVYGSPVPVYPGYSTGTLVATSLISFGVGVAVGAAIHGGWGWNSWGCGWHNNTVVYNHNTYISTSNTFVNRNNYYNRNVSNVNRTNVNINQANVNNYRTHNFNQNARNTNFTEPRFNTKYDQPQYRNQAANQQRNQLTSPQREQRTAQARGANEPRFNEQRGAVNQNRAGSFNQGQTYQPQREASRGYGQQPSRGMDTGAFSNYSQGGNARMNSARGEQSLQGGRQQGGGSFAGNRGGSGRGGARPQAQRGGGRRR
jgi:hypothetical protein